jgi:iron(III) transport system substrate-binding protein
MRLIIIRNENNSQSQINKGKEKDKMKKITILAMFLTFFTNLSFAAEVNVFSARHYDSDIQLYKKFTEKTGIKVNVVSGKDKALQKRITEEGEDSKADIYITADAGRLGAFDAKGMFQKSMTPAIKAVVPKNFRSTNWTGIAKRARIMYYSPERVNANELNGMTYEGLADPKWKGRVVIRKSNNIYNQSLVASLVKHNGKKATCEWSKSVVSNMARDSKGNDRAQILAVAAGEADLAVANTYYLALMLSGKKGAEQQAAAKKVLPFFPNQGDRGTHMNISGGGVLKNAPNPENAKKLLEFLLTKEAQKHIVNNTFEYPMIEGVEPHDLVKQMGLGFKQDLDTKVVNYGKNQAIALECMLAAKWK